MGKTFTTGAKAILLKDVPYHVVVGWPPSPPSQTQCCDVKIFPIYFSRFTHPRCLKLAAPTLKQGGKGGARVLPRRWFLLLLRVGAKIVFPLLFPIDGSVQRPVAFWGVYFRSLGRMQVGASANSA